MKSGNRDVPDKLIRPHPEPSTRPKIDDMHIIAANPTNHDKLSLTI